MKILKPDKYDIKIEKKQDNYVMLYREFYLKGRENLKEALDYTYKIAKGYPLKVKKIEDEKYCGFEFIIDSSFESISDFLAGEFLAIGNIGNLTIAQIFAAFGTLSEPPGPRTKVIEG